MERGSDADSRLFERAPFDPALAGVLARHPATRMVALDYLSGFSKINNPNRFAADVFADEAGRFERMYRPVGQIDRQRHRVSLSRVDRPRRLSTLPRRVRGFGRVRDRAGHPLRGRAAANPERIRSKLPGEAEFDATLRRAMDRRQVEYHDFSMVNNEERLFYDSDHLNKAGVLSFFEHHFAALFRPSK